MFLRYYVYVDSDINIFKYSHYYPVVKELNIYNDIYVTASSNINPSRTCNKYENVYESIVNDPTDY